MKFLSYLSALIFLGGAGGLSAVAATVSKKTSQPTHSAMSSASTPKRNPKIPLTTVQHVDIPRYMGDWRVIANIPYFAEKGCVDSIEGYKLRPDGKIANTFTYRKKSFDQPQKQFHAVATVYNQKTNAEWRVKFFGLISAKYLITDLDPDYQWSVVAHPSKKYGWVLARAKTLPDATYHAIMRRLEKQGYDPADFQKVPQLPSQVGH